MDAFWSTAADLSFSCGFSLFGREHLLWLCGIALCAVLIFRYARGHAVAVSRCLALFLFISEASKDFFLLYKGQFVLTELPLYLCSVAPFLILADLLFPQYGFFLDVLYGVNLPGTLCALLFPNWTFQPPFHYLSAHSFVFHGLIAIYIVFQLLCGRRPHALRGFFSCVLFVALYAPFIKLLDARLNTNFLFLEAPPPGSPLVWAFETFGAFYLPIYALCGAVLIEAMYLPLQLPILRAKLRNPHAD